MAANPPGQGNHDVPADVLLQTFWFLSLKAFIQVQLSDDLLFRCTRNVFIQLYEGFFLPVSLPKQGSGGNLGRVGEREETADSEPVHRQVRGTTQQLPVKAQFMLMVCLFSIQQHLALQDEPEGIQRPCRAASHCCSAESCPAGQRGSG